MTVTEGLWEIVSIARNGILATIDSDGIPQLSNIYYLADPPSQLIRFSTTTARAKGRNLLRDPRATLHIPGHNFFNFAVVTGRVTLAVPRRRDDEAVDELFEIHSRLGAAIDRKVFGEEIIVNRRVAVRLRVERIYGQLLDRETSS